MTGAEISIFGAFLDEKLRTSGWVLSRATDFFMTKTARELSQAIVNSFPSRPPVGPPNNWISQLLPEEMQDLLSEVLTDERIANLSEEFVADAVEKLKTKREDRKRRSELEGSTGLDDKAKIFEQLKERKGIKDETSPEDDLF